MLLYPLNEAVLLLSEKLSVAKRSLRHTKEDLEFLREQITVMEVNFARVHNVSEGAETPFEISAKSIGPGMTMTCTVGCQKVSS